MSDFKLTTPVAMIIFNRPDTTEKVFEEIRKAQPPKLLIVADGARANRAGEAERCIELARAWHSKGQFEYAMEYRNRAVAQWPDVTIPVTLA